MDKELPFDQNTVHPLESAIATNDAVAKQDGKYAQSAIVHLGVTLLRWFSIFAILSAVLMLSSILEKYGHWDHWSNVFSYMFINIVLFSVVYLEMALLEKISPSKFQFRISSKGFQLDILLIFCTIALIVAILISFLGPWK